MVAWIRDSSNQGALAQLEVMHVVSSGLAHLSVARTLLIQGLRARCLFSRAKAWGLSLRPDGPSDPVATGDMLWTRWVWSHGYVIIVIMEPWFRLGVMCAAPPRARAPLGWDAALLRGFVMAVIRAPMLPMDRAARLIEIHDNSYSEPQLWLEVMSVVSSRCGHLSIARMLLIGGFRARFPFSRAREGGCPQGRTAPRPRGYGGHAVSKVGMVAWNRDSSNLGAPVPAWDSVLCHPRARALA